MSIYGIDLMTKKQIHYVDYDGLYYYVNRYAEVGDTLIKKQGQSSFSLKKKSINLFIDYKCINVREGQTVIDTVFKRTK